MFSTTKKADLKKQASGVAQATDALKQKATQTNDDALAMFRASVNKLENANEEIDESVSDLEQLMSNAQEAIDTLKEQKGKNETVIDNLSKFLN